jgi:hypothetical protein
MNKDEIRKLERMLDVKLRRLHLDIRDFNRLDALDVVLMLEIWDGFLEKNGCLLHPKGILAEPVEHPKGFILVSDPARLRAIAVPEEFALKALMLGEIP